MKVLKFGGTSVGTVESLQSVKKIVEDIPGKAIIVVSALGGLTDKLISTARMAASGNEEWKKEMQGIILRHHKIIETLVPEENRDKIKERVNRQLTGLHRNYEGVFLLRDLPERILDIIVSFGERMSSIIVAAIINNGKRYFSPDFIKTEKWYGKNIVNRDLTDSLVKEAFRNMEENEKAIVPGFISSDTVTGDITNLGRGGSDYTGALIAASMDAEVLEIWTDVDGFMTADPRIVKDAILISNLSFTESMELCSFGAKVIYPPTIYPVFHKNIPIRILNTFNLKSPGTLITDHHHKDEFDVKGVTALKGISLITIPTIPDKQASEFSQRAFNALAKQGISIIPVASPDPFDELKVAVAGGDAKKSLDILSKEFAPEIAYGLMESISLKEELAAVALVGKDMKSRGRLAARIGHSLSRSQINLEAFSMGNSETTIFYIINQEKCNEALPLIHSLIY